MTTAVAAPRVAPESRARTLHPLALLLMLPAAVGLVACSGSQGAGAPGGGAPMAAPVSVAPAVQREVQDFDEFSGRLEAAQTVDIRARVAGAIEQVHFREGQDVRKGDLLFSIDARPYRAELARAEAERARAEAQLVSARTQAALARTELARTQKLVEVKAGSQQELDQQAAAVQGADAAVQSAQAAVQSAQAAAQAAALNVGYAEVRAPISGRISRINAAAAVGNLVSATDPVLTTLVSTQPVYAYFDASEEIYLKYGRLAREGNRSGARKGQSGIQMGLANETGFPHHGVVDFVDNRLNPQTGAIQGRAVFDNAGHEFTPGLFARLKLGGGAPHAAVLTPERAIGTDQTKKFVLVLAADSTAQFREVKLGPLQDGMRVITEGLKAGELVVVDGLQRAHPGAPVKAETLKVDALGMPIVPAPAAAPGQHG